MSLFTQVALNGCHSVILCTFVLQSNKKLRKGVGGLKSWEPSPSRYHAQDPFARSSSHFYTSADGSCTPHFDPHFSLPPVFDDGYYFQRHC